MSHSQAAAAQVGSTVTRLTTPELRWYWRSVKVVATSHAATVSRGVGTGVRRQCSTVATAAVARFAAYPTDSSVSVLPRAITSRTSRAPTS